MKLEPPITQYLTGPTPTHSSLNKISSYVKAWSQEEVEQLLKKAEYLTEEGKPTKGAAQKGIIDLCEGKVLWNLLEVKRALVGQNQVEIQAKAAAESARQARIKSEPAWVDLATIGTYFGVGNVVIGKWLDELRLREKPSLQINESGAFDLLDVAREAQQKQANGFIGKVPTEKALNMGVARKLTVMNRKQQEIEIVQWNLDLCKAVLVRAGHELDTEHKMALKGKGKNGDVQVITADERAKDLYNKWRALHANTRTRSDSWKTFAGQPTILLVKVEALMNRPGFLTRKLYLTELY
jgi:hypothetical protein